MHTAIQHRVIGAFSQQLQNELFEPGLIWPALDESMKQALGHIIFSVLAYDRDGQRMVRLYSNHPDRIPVGGIKTVTDSEWTRRVLMEGTLFVNSNEGDIRRVFPDHERILSLRCASALNIPVKLMGVVVGSINLLARQEFYDYIDPDVAWTFAQLIAPVLAEAVRSLPPGTVEAGSVERV